MNKIKRNLDSLKSKKQSKKNKVYPTYSRWRYRAVALIIALVAGLLISRLAYIQVIEA